MNTTPYPASDRRHLLVVVDLPGRVARLEPGRLEQLGEAFPHRWGGDDAGQQERLVAQLEEAHRGAAREAMGVCDQNRELRVADRLVEETLVPGWAEGQRHVDPPRAELLDQRSAELLPASDAHGGVGGGEALKDRRSQAVAHQWCHPHAHSSHQLAPPGLAGRGERFVERCERIARAPHERPPGGG